MQGKVTSSGKRLSPTSVATGSHRFLGGKRYYTEEVIQDDGSFGSSIPYLYFWDTAGRFQKVYPDPVYVKISDQPLPVRDGALVIETVQPDPPAE